MRLLRRLNEERGQLIIFFVGLFSVISVIAAITIDFGLWFSERQGVERAADLAALAGSQSLLRHAGKTEAGANSLADNQRAIADACMWAKRNGYEDGVGGVSVDVRLHCRNTVSGYNAAGMCLQSSDEASCSADNFCPLVNSGEVPSASDKGCDSIEVTINKPAARLFSSIFHVAGRYIGRRSAAGETTQAVPLDVVMAADSTGSQHDGCNSAETGPDPAHPATPCPIKETKDAAANMTQYLLPAGTDTTQVGFAAFRGCYNPPNNNSACVYDVGHSNPQVINLSTNPAPIMTAIANTHSANYQGGSGSGTNVCLALWRAQQMLPTPVPGNNLRKYIVILSDGDNTYDAFANPPSPCRPATPGTSDDYTGTDCHAAQPHEVDLDGKTKAEAATLAGQGVEIYVVAFGVCGNPDSTVKSTSYCAGIGNNAADDVADRRLLKCIASSKPGTNDHYYEVPNASDLGKIFQAIAWAITGRSLTQ